MEEREIESEVAPEEPSMLMKFLSSVKDIQHRHAHFSQSAVDSLPHELWGEDDEIDNFKSRRSSIYLLVVISSGFDHSWLRLDAAEDDDGESLTPKLSLSCIDSTMRHPDSKFPPKLLYYCNYGCTVWGSRIIIAGGTYEPPVHYVDDDIKPSKEVYAYDTIAEKWDQLPPMVARRGYHPVLVATEDMIFVFGGNARRHRGIYVEDKEKRAKKLFKWAEYYDTKAKQPSWRCFTELPPTELLEYSPLCSYAVYPKGSLILFYVEDCSRIVSFNYSSWVWKIYNAEDHPIAKGPVWSASVVVIDHFLFWHDEKTIYGHDLSMPKGVILPVYSFDLTSRFCYPARDFQHINFEPRCSFLVRFGKDELCLLWLEKRNTIRYFIFRIHICEPAAALELVLGQTGLLEAPVADIGFAFEVSHLVNGMTDAHPVYSKKRKAVIPPESSSTTPVDVLSRIESSLATLSAAFTTMNLTLTGKLEDLSTQLRQVQADVSEMKPIVMGFDVPEPVDVSDDDDDDDGPLFQPRPTVVPSVPPTTASVSAPTESSAVPPTDVSASAPSETSDVPSVPVVDDQSGGAIVVGDVATQVDASVEPDHMESETLRPEDVLS